MLIIMFTLKQTPPPFVCITARFLLMQICRQTLCYHTKPFIALMLPFKEDFLMWTLKGVAYSRIRIHNLKKTSKIPLIVYIRLKFLEQINTIDCKWTFRYTLYPFLASDWWRTDWSPLQECKLWIILLKPINNYTSVRAELSLGVAHVAIFLLEGVGERMRQNPLDVVMGYLIPLMLWRFTCEKTLCKLVCLENKSYSFPVWEQEA